MNGIELTEDEKKIRFQWLVVFLGSLVFGLGTQVFEWFNSTNPVKMAYPEMFIAMMIGTFVGSAGTSALQYYCMYAKPGTRWLTFILFVSPIGLAFLFYLMVSGKYVTRYGTWHSVITLASMALFWVVCFRLRKVNRRVLSASKGL